MLLEESLKFKIKKVLAVVETGGSLNRKGTTYLPFYLQQKVNTKFIFNISRTPYRYQFKNFLTFADKNFLAQNPQMHLLINPSYFIKIIC